MKTRTFRDITFYASHSLQGRGFAAQRVHWHTYNARLWFVGDHNQEDLVKKAAALAKMLSGSCLNEIMGDSPDELLAAWIMAKMGKSCDRVTLTNDGCRGAEVWR